MDYLGWELERQRAALAALLSGGGEARDGESVREGERRSPEGPEMALGSAGGLAGRYAGGRSGNTGGSGYTGKLADGALGAWEAIRMAGTDCLLERTAGPVSAWEEIVGVSGIWEQAGREEESGASANSGQAFRQRGRRTLSGGTGAQMELSRPSGGYEAADRETAAETAGKRHAGERPAERPSGGGEAAEEVPPGMGAGGGEIAGERGIRTFGESTDMGGFTRQWSGLRRSVEAGAPDVSPWGGVRETAALWAEDSARALSRAVQRDARRYDGGFNIY